MAIKITWNSHACFFIETHQARLLIELKQVIPIHYDTFEVIKQDAHAWAKRMQNETAAKVTVMKPGESLNI